MTYNEFLELSVKTGNTPRLLGITYKTTNEFLKINRIVSVLDNNFFFILKQAMGKKSFTNFFSEMYENKITKEELTEIVSNYKKEIDNKIYFTNICTIINNRSIKENINKEFEKNNDTTIWKYGDKFKDKYITTKTPTPKHYLKPWLDQFICDIKFKKIKINDEEEKIKEHKIDYCDEEQKIEELIDKFEEQKIDENCGEEQKIEEQIDKIEEQISEIKIEEKTVEKTVEKVVEKVVEKTVEKTVEKPKISLVFKEGKVFNPDSKRWVLVTGLVGKEVIRKYS